MDKTNRKSNKEIVLDPENNQAKVQEKSAISQLAGLNDKFPIENFVKLTTKQKGKIIHLQTYKYPVKSEDTFKGVVYLMFLYIYFNY
jgi:hypothetical protein